jgi:hypothetical protein
MNTEDAKTLKVGSKVRYANDNVPGWCGQNWCRVGGLKLGKIYTISPFLHAAVDSLKINGCVFYLPIAQFELVTSIPGRVLNFLKRLFGIK